MLLYTFGDSFTYGEELAEPNKTAWPVLLSEKLGYDLINHGAPGASNDYIVRNIVDNVPLLKPDLVIVAWTACHRQEFADQWDMFSIWPGCSGLGVTECYRSSSLGAAKHRHELIKYITMYNDPEYQYRQWLQKVILIQSYFKALQIPYIFVDAFDYNVGEYCEFNTTAQTLIEQIDTKNYVGWPDKSFVNWSFGLPHGAGGHPLEAGHQSIAQNLYNEIEKRSLKK